MAILQLDWQQRLVWKLAPWTTVGRALVAATQRLEESGSETASLDAQVLLAHVLGVDRAWLFAHYDEKLTPEQADNYAELVARRAAAEPVAYLVGHREFYGLDLLVDHRVLIPRPETELLVDAVLDHIDSRPNKAVKMVDVGAGSGAIALAVAANCPGAHIYAVDLSPDALAVARANVARLDERGQITLLQGDLLAPLPERVDIIAANLPYIASPVYLTLAADVRDYEPRLALEAGPEGLDAIARLLRQAPDHLNPGGVLFLEIAHDQGQAVLALAAERLPQASYVGLRQDYHGYDRLVVIGL
ncbi:MAG TPA: peptide chain release factor N(5)-glutamine methyltransferase [Caldilineaceae bacterium]|nr:peptide chain release factor N(5)-glutamine methyltransferase [Caldilineaceae bacterium]